MPPATIALVLLARARDAAALAAERERRAHDRRQADLVERRARLGDARRDRAARHAQAGARASSRGTGRGPRRGGSRRSWRRSARRRSARACRPRAASVARFSAVWPPSVGSSASGRSRAMTCVDRAGQQRLDVGRRRELRVGHDRRRVGVDEHDLVALLGEDLAGLRARSSRTRPPGRSRSAPSRGSGSAGCRRGAASGGDLGDEAVEEVQRVVRARARPRGGTGRCWRAPSAAAGPRRCGRRG